MYNYKVQDYCMKATMYMANQKVQCCGFISAVATQAVDTGSQENH